MLLRLALLYDLLAFWLRPTSDTAFSVIAGASSHLSARELRDTGRYLEELGTIRGGRIC